MRIHQVAKSDIAIEYILRQIVQNKANVVFFSLEMPRGKIMERIVCKMTQKAYIRS